MKYFHSAEIAVFTKTEQNEISERIKKVISDILCPDKKEKTKIEQNIETIAGFLEFSDTMYKIQIKITSEKLVEKLITTLRTSCKNIFDKILISHISESGESYIRFETDAFTKGIFEPIEQGTGLQVKVHLAAYPAKKDAAIKTYEAFIREKH